MTTPYLPTPITPAQGRDNRAAFEAALMEMDYDTYRRVDTTIHRIASGLVRVSGMSKETALLHASEFVASCIWKKAQGR